MNHKKPPAKAVFYGERGIRSPRARPTRFVDPPRPSYGAIMAPFPSVGRRGTRFESPDDFGKA